MRVLHIVPGLSARAGGIAASVVELARGLNEMDLTTAIVAPDLANAPGSPHVRVSNEDLPPGSETLDVRIYRTQPPRRIAFSPDLVHALRTGEQWDVVHIHSLFLHPQFAGYRYAVATGTPYVVTPHGVFDRFHRSRGRLRKSVNDRLWQRRMLERSSALHFGSEEEALQADDVATAVPRIVIPNSIDWASFGDRSSSGRFRERAFGDRRGPIVLFFGRVAQKKGVDLLVRAFEHTLEHVPDALLAIVGPDDEGLTPELHQLAGGLGVADRVAFCGPLYGDDRRQALVAADVWALASRGEGCSAAVLEALAAGSACVLSPEVTIAREISRAKAAVIASTDPQAFSRELVTLLRDGERRARLRATARRFSQRYDRAVIAAQWRDRYREIAASSRVGTYNLAAPRPQIVDGAGGGR